MSVGTQILDAAYDLAVSRGWTKVTMAELATAAGVSRQSVYNEFGSREAVAVALVNREVGHFLRVVDACLRQADDPTRAVVAAAEAVFEMADENPLLRAVLTGDDQSLVPLFSSDRVIAVASEHVRAGLPGTDDLTIDVIVRFVISHAVSPGSSRPDMTAVAERLL